MFFASPPRNDLKPEMPALYRTLERIGIIKIKDIITPKKLMQHEMPVLNTGMRLLLCLTMIGLG